MAAQRWDAAMVVAALGRAGFGGSPDEVARTASMGWENWVEEQLRPNDGADGECHRRLQQLKLRIKYNAAEKWAAVDEMRPLKTLDQPIEDDLAAHHQARRNGRRRAPAAARRGDRRHHPARVLQPLGAARGAGGILARSFQRRRLWRRAGRGGAAEL